MNERTSPAFERLLGASRDAGEQAYEELLDACSREAAGPRGTLTTTARSEVHRALLDKALTNLEGNPDRQYLAYGIAEVAGEEIVPRVADWLGRPELQVFARQILTEIGGPRAAAALAERALQSPLEQERSHLLADLSRLGAVHEEGPVLPSPDSRLRRRLLEELAQGVPRSFYQRPLGLVADRLAKLMRHREHELAAAACFDLLVAAAGEQLVAALPAPRRRRVFCPTHRSRAVLTVRARKACLQA